MLKRVLCFLGIFGIWSDSAGGNGRVANSLPQNPLNYRAERSVADEDRTHRFVASYVYELPVGQLANLTDTGNPSNTGGPDRPNVIHDWHLAGGQSLQRWFDTTAFALNAPFGNAGRNLLRGPRQTNLDFAIYKAFRITERFRLQFRAEAFNATNTPAFGAPNAQVGAPAFE